MIGLLGILSTMLLHEHFACLLSIIGWKWYMPKMIYENYVTPKSIRQFPNCSSIVSVNGLASETCSVDHY